MPVLVITGTEDQPTPATHMPGARNVRLLDAGEAAQPHHTVNTTPPHATGNAHVVWEV